MKFLGVLKLSKYKFDSLLCSFSRLSTGFITLALMPFYLPLLGEEAFGLFGLFASIEVFFRILEGGLGSVLIKDFATKEAKGEGINPLLRTFEVVYLLLGFLQCLICVGAVKLGFFSFLNIEELSQETVDTSLLILSLRFVFGTVSVVHDAVITARAQIVTLNCIRLTFCLLSGLGALVVLKISNGDPIWFFSWWVITVALIGLLKCLVSWQWKLKTLLLTKPSLQLIAPYKNHQLHLMFFGALMFLSTQYPIWISSTMMSLGMIGVFSLAQRINTTLGSTLAALTRPMIARYAKEKESQSDQAGGRILAMMSEVLIIVGLLSAAAFFLTAEVLIQLWIPDKGFDSQGLAQLAGLLYFSTTINMFSMPYIQALTSERQFASLYRRVGFSIIVGPILLYFGIREFGLIGIGWALLVIGVVTHILFYHKLAGHFQGGPPLSSLYRRSVIPAILFALLLGVLSFIVSKAGLFAAAASTIFFAGVFVLLLLWKWTQHRDASRFKAAI